MSVLLFVCVCRFLSFRVCGISVGVLVFLSLNIYMSALGAYLRELERAEATAGDADQQQPHGSLTVIDPSPVLQSLTCQVSHRPTHSFHAERGEDPKGIPRSVPLLSLPRDSGTEPAVLGRPLTTLGGFSAAEVHI